MNQKREIYCIRKLLNFPIVYRVFENFIGGAKSGRQDFLNRYVGDFTGKSVLDLGCGTADILDCIEGERVYVGIDSNKRYIKENRRRYFNRKSVRFHYTDLNEYADKAKEKFDVVFMLGVMHHISDDEVDKAMISINKLLKDGGGICFFRCLLYRAYESNSLGVVPFGQRSVRTI